MKNSKFLLVIFTLSMFFATQGTKAIDRIDKIHISSAIGLFSLVAGVFKKQALFDKMTNMYRESKWNPYFKSAILMASGIAASINTFLYSKKISKKEVLIYLLSMIAIELGYFEYENCYITEGYDQFGKEYIMKNARIKGSLIGTGLGLIGSTLIKIILEKIIETK